MGKGNNTVLFVSLGIAAAGIAVFARFANWWGLSLAVQPQNVASVMAPLLLTAGFIERAVEVVITPWRDPGATRLKTALSAAKANPAATDAQAAAQAAIDAFQGKTTQYAFAIAALFGLVAAMVGVRALWPFLDPTAMTIFKAASLVQQNTFIVFDVVLSAALLAGGANGIHSVVTAFTTFFDTTAQKAQQSVNQ